MIEQLPYIRCEKCNKVLMQAKIEVGAIRISCKYYLCRHMNIIEGSNKTPVSAKLNYAG